MASPSITLQVNVLEHQRRSNGSLRYIGTSIGALIGGLYAREGDIITSTGRAKQFSGRMGNIWRILSDVTYPIVAYTTVCHISGSYEVIPLMICLSFTRGTNSIGPCTRYRMLFYYFSCWHTVWVVFLWPSHRGYVAALLLQHHEHHYFSNGNSWDRLCVEIHS